MKKSTDRQAFIVKSAAGSTVVFAVFSLLLSGLLIIVTGFDYDYEHFGLPILTGSFFGLINGIFAALAVHVKHGSDYVKIRSRIMWRLALWCVVCAIVFFK